uniref:Translation initiation factor IF-2, chloroplastic n=1 Tax=Polysiphonia elongata TaxID=159753 RepID=A0A1Z1MBL7_9FLOR|nr:translation initiation factor 2 [Polysiphonia elongata]ARW63323.1 translation initiation factor 2 [Polysiphonia elongata]
MNILIVSVNKYKCKKLSFFCFHRDYYDDILILKSPRLLKTVISNPHLSISVDDIITSNDVKVPSLVKFDKKSKSSINTDQKDLIKSKKSKSKLSKNKNRNDSQDVNQIVSSEEDLFGNDLMSRSGLKSRKSLVKSKKNKIKNQNLDIPVNIYNLNLDISKDDNSIDQISKDIVIDKILSVKDLAICINVPVAEIITYLFLDKGIAATINQILDFEICADIVKYYGFNLLKSNNNKIDVLEHQSSNKLSSESIERSPVISILGHVDHGKTTLLDSILKTNLVDKEPGGITQSIAAYEVIYLHENKEFNLTFLDTPGHESFKSIRLRGAKITDIVLLIVAMDDGLKQQTIESINYIKEMSLSCIIVITKSDKVLNNLDKIKDDLAKHNLICQDWGGDVPLVEVSAIKGNNIDILLSKICFLAKSKNLYANLQDLASGTVIDTILHKKQGLITTMIIQNGTLRVGDIVVSDNLLGRVKSIINSSEVRVQSSYPSSVVRILCFSSIPKAGSYFYCFNSEKEAKKYIIKSSDLLTSDLSFQSLNTRISFYDQIPRKQLKLIIKSDTQGSLEAIIELFSTISQLKVQINVIDASFGNVTNNDIDLSIASQAPIIAFNVNLLPQISNLIKKHQINFKMFNIIYDLLEYVQKLMLDILEPEYANILIGNAIVQTIFKNNKGSVAGCIVSSGKVIMNSYINVHRNNIIVHKGYITSLKYTKNDVTEVVSPSECGLMSDFQDWQKSDLIEVYEMVLKEKVL